MIRLGNIAPLKDPSARIMIRTCSEKEEVRRRTGTAAKSTDTLTKAGYELFDILRNLRLTIAREEGLPPYIIFSDKTLIDMSARTPRDRDAMLAVSGVGEVKFEKYGERFLDEIAAFLEENPDSVTSILDNESAPSNRVDYNRRMNRPDGAGMPWTEEEDTALDEENNSGKRIADIARAHSRTNGAIRARLKKHGLIE